MGTDLVEHDDKTTYRVLDSVRLNGLAMYEATGKCPCTCTPSVARWATALARIVSKELTEVKEKDWDSNFLPDVCRCCLNHGHREALCRRKKRG